MLLYSLISTSYYSPNIANASSLQTTNNEKFVIEYLEITAKYQKIKFTNKETGEIEYLEADFTKENPEYLATFNDQESKQLTEVLVTRSDEGIIIINNLTTNEIHVEKIFNNIPTKQIQVANKFDNSIQPLGLPGGNGPYEHIYTFRGSKSLVDNGVTNVATIAALLATVYGGVVAGVIVTIATYLWTAGADKFYYIHELYYYMGSPSRPAAFVRYYENSNFTGHLGSVYDNFIWH